MKSTSVLSSFSLIAILIFTVLLSVNPYPKSLNNLEARFEYTRQLLGQITGLSSGWDVERLNAVYKRTTSEPVVPLPETKHRPFNLSPLPTVDAKDPNWRAQFHELFSVQEVPVVVRGLMYEDAEMFPKAKEWNIDYLKNKVYKGRSVPVFTDTLNDKSAVMEPFADYVENLKNKSHIRYARCLDDVNQIMGSGFSMDKLTGLMNKKLDFELSVLMNGLPPQCLFVGSTQVATRMHSDVATSAFMMIQGRKRWTMFPASESMYFLPVPHLYNVAYNSRVNIFDENLLETYPLARFAKGWEVVIEEGDVLFFPAFTWHGVENLDELTVGLDLAVYDIPLSLRSNPLLALGTMFDVKVWAKVALATIQGQTGGLKRVFFEGYMKEEEALKDVGVDPVE